MEHTVTVMQWYVVSGTAGATVSTPEGVILCTVPDGGQGTFYATTPKVVTSDDSVTVVKATFNLAPAKLRALGLLGGGVSTNFPSGCIPAAWVIFNGASYIDTEIIPADDVGMRAEITFFRQNDLIFAGSRGDGATRFYMSRPKAGGYYAGFGWNLWNYFDKDISVSKEEWFTSYLNFKNSRTSGFKSQNDEINANIEQLLSPAGFPIYIGCANIKNAASLFWSGNCKHFQITKGTGIVRDLIPVLQEGKPAFFDKVSKKVFLDTQNSGLGVGLTLAQARKLGKHLPAGGGTLTISLPSNWQEDEGVVDALATAEAKGWVITYQTYEAEAGAASTFALRRIWVRKTQDEGGSYVAADGSRWHVEWCAGMIGADPQEHGYEPFRSVDAAVSYWELEPYVYTEEELLTETTTNEHE